MQFKFTKRQQQVLFSIVLSLIIGLFGLDKAEVINLIEPLEQHQPGLYQVTKIDDGDTITINSSGKEERVRLIGVDTPELHHPEKPVQCFAEAARAYTIHLIGEHDVRLQADPEDDNRDLYGRLLRYVYLPDGTLVNAKLIQEGYGFAYTRFPFLKLEEFRSYEQAARDGHKGLWQGCSVIDLGATRETTAAE